MSQHHGQEDDSPPLPLRRELDLSNCRNAMTSFRGSTGQIMNEVRASVRSMRENNARLAIMHYFTIALLLFVIALDLLKFIAIP